MAVAMKSNGLHHAVSLGTIELSSKPCYSHHFDRSYDSEDENMGRRRLRHTSSTELYPRPSIYSKGDIKEQYCLTDRQLNTIERPRRDRFFGCLSRRGAPQSFLGGCVGRRAPSDENLVAYAPFYKYPRYHHQQHHPDDKSDVDLQSSYFRRQPASILSTSKTADVQVGVGNGRQNWMGLQMYSNNENSNFMTNEQSNYHCPAHLGLTAVPPHPGPDTPRTKHVSFARSHTLTSFDEVNLGLNHSTNRLKVARSQERLIGGKKAIISQMYDPTTMQQNSLSVHNQFVGTNSLPIQQHSQQPLMQQHTHMHPHLHGHSHHHSPLHIHQFVPSPYNAKIQDCQPIPLLQSSSVRDDIPNINIGLLPCTTKGLPPSAPEVVVVEKKFRNAMKTQATQTEVRREDCTQVLALSPRTLHKVRVVSQGAQTMGLQAGKKLTKSLSEMPNGKPIIGPNRLMENNQQRVFVEHEAVYRTQSEEPQKLAVKSFQTCLDDVMSDQSVSADFSEDIWKHSYHQFNNGLVFQYNTVEPTPDIDKEKGSLTFNYESNSLPRRSCNHYRLENEFSSHSLPRRDQQYSQDICKHITECSELRNETTIIDFTKPHLLPPPLQYCKVDETPQEKFIHQSSQYLKPNVDVNRRMSMVVATNENSLDTPFRRDDIRRQSMPGSIKMGYFVTDYVTSSSHKKIKPEKLHFIQKSCNAEEKEILIDFKPHISASFGSKSNNKYRDNINLTSHDTMHERLVNECEYYEDSDGENYVDEKLRIPYYDSENDSEHDPLTENDDPVYENIPVCNQISIQTEFNPADSLRKRSVSLDDSKEIECKLAESSQPPSPCKVNILASASTYPSSDSLANDNTRDHSDGIWNESQATVLTVDQKDTCDGLNLLTPSTRRKNLVLQHQQRSSVETEALDYEDHYVDDIEVPRYIHNTIPSPAAFAQHIGLDVETSIITPKIGPPSIAVTQTYCGNEEIELHSPKKSANLGRRSSNSLLTSHHDYRGSDMDMSQQQKSSDFPSSHVSKPDTSKMSVTNNDVSECSTNTDEYATCTGIKTPPITTSSSSTTQVPVSTQSSLMDKTHGGSSFESASSLYSTRGEVLSEDAVHQEDRTPKIVTDIPIQLQKSEASAEPVIKSPTHSISSTSSGSYNIARPVVISPVKENATTYNEIITSPKPVDKSIVHPIKAKTKLKPESISDDDHSEIRYSSSGYYESPHDENHPVTKSRRQRLDEDRKRRKTSMKLDIEKENMRALTSPIKKSQLLSTTARERYQEKEQQLLHSNDASSPNKIKRLRPKIRRQFKRSTKDDNTPRRQNIANLYGFPTLGSTEKLIDCGTAHTKNDCSTQKKIEITSKATSQPVATKSASEVTQLKAKSIESLRSVSPGSDSVFYSEADGITPDQQNHCLHCGKEMEDKKFTISTLEGDSVESLPYIENENEQNIVKPPSDFADSPVTIKTTQRLYKKMDKRFRSEDRYHGERGRHYKSRQENVRAKSEERTRESNMKIPPILRPAGSSPCVLPDSNSEQIQQIIYKGHYDTDRYARLTDEDVWTQLSHQSFDHQRDRKSSTESERGFYTKYQVILHRLVQRRCTLEMYHRQKNNTFRVDKTVVVKSDSGEFGFRIHGSKPVVVAAIEPDTPAESSGLEVGDIIISVNNVQVLDKHHTEVVKIAHDGCETLELQVARTIGILLNEQQEPPSPPIFCGYLWRQSGQAKGCQNNKKWVRRWFSLRPDNGLYYYKTENDSQPVGAMIMTKHTIERCPPDIGKPFAFKIDSGEGIPMHVAADTEELTAQWIKVLKQAAFQNTTWLEKCSQYIYQPPSSIARPDCFGYLLKLGSRWCGWSKRYCVLKDACLYFFQDVNSKNAFGMACLHGYKVVSMSVSASGKKNSFEIIPPESKLRHYYFCTESEMDKKRWISALEYSIDRWIKSG